MSKIRIISQMRILYDIGIGLYGALLRLISPFHPKAKLWVAGRKNILDRLEQSIEKGQKYIWFHFASLGEFEQGRSVLEQIKKSFPQQKIVITFFSPSGYEIRKNTALADYVCYLPEDTASNARRFIALFQPQFAVFTKYEYWYYYFKELNKKEVPLLMISAIFREEQIFFRFYGSFFRRILKNVSYFFTQNIESAQMLRWIGVTNAGYAGDTRFDRVIELAKQHEAILEIEQFVNDKLTLVAGSTWLPDEERLARLMNIYPSWKLVLAPHEIHEDRIKVVLKQFPTSLLFSQFSSYSAHEIADSQVLIIDNIGMLSSLYYYADIAYVGGGFGAGIHNTLEAATYGVPIIFGPNYARFKEAVDLVTIMAAFSIQKQSELDLVFSELQDLSKRKECGQVAKKYVQQNAGATQIIMKYLKTEKLLS